MIRKRRTHVTKRATVNSCASRRRSMLRTNHKKTMTRRRSFVLNQLGEDE